MRGFQSSEMWLSCTCATWPQHFCVILLVLAGPATAGRTYLGPLACSDVSCPSTASGSGRTPNNTNFHLRDVAITAGPDGYYYLTGTSNAGGDGYWTDVWGVVRVWRSKTPLQPGSYVGGKVIFNISRDCKFCGPATAAGGCRVPNSCARCGVGDNSSTGGCTPKKDCGGRVWAPELHYLAEKAADVPGSGGWFISYHFHCAGGGSGVLRSTTASPFGPFTDLVEGVPGGDVSLFRDPADGVVYTISSGSSIVASRLSKDMSRIENKVTISPECGSVPCEHTAIGFEGPYVIHVNGTYFLSSSAFGDRQHHGGPRSVYNNDSAAPRDSHYSSFMGRASSLLGPYTDGVGKRGSWLGLDYGGHNNYFKFQGDIYGTVWYGSDPHHGKDSTPEERKLVNLPSVAKMRIDDGRLVEDAS